MANGLSVLGHQLKEIWKHFGVNQKVSTLGGLLLAVAVIGGVLFWSSRPSYRLLYAGMSLKDAASAREKLEDEKILVELRDSGRSIYVPAKDVYRGRLLLAEDGLPNDNSTGFELFQEPKFGLTDFAQKVNFQRALQGELERTIAGMKGISSARIMLVLPKERLFSKESDKQASASILLNMEGGAVLTRNQVDSIRQLVGSAVPGLVPSSITITDQYGRLLSQKLDPGEDDVRAASEHLEKQEKLEALLTRKAQAMLDTALGAGRSIVRVSADLDFSRIEKRKETYDSEGRVVSSEEISTESSSSPGSSSGGAVNVAVKNPNKVMVEERMSKTKREDISTKYKVPNGVEHIIDNGIRVRSLSVSVCVAKAEKPRAPEEMKGIENMVRTAVGFVETEARKDAIQVVEMTFPAPPEPIRAAWWNSLPIPLRSILNGVVAVVLLVVIFIGSRRMVARLSVEREDVGIPVGPTNPLKAMDASPTGLMGPDGESEPSLDQAQRLAEQNPRAVAAWITNVTRGM